MTNQCINHPRCTLFEFLSAWSLSASRLFFFFPWANIDCVSHDVAASDFNKRQKLDFSSDFLPPPLPQWLQKACWTLRACSQLCDAGVWRACRSVQHGRGWRHEAAWPESEGPQRDPGIRYECWADPRTVLTPANGWPVLRETKTRKCLASWRTVPLACSLYLDSCIYLHRGTEYIRSEKRWRS